MEKKLQGQAKEGMESEDRKAQDRNELGWLVL